MPRRQPPRLQMILDRLGQAQEAQGVGDMAAALADNGGDGLGAVVRSLHDRGIATRLFQGVEIGPLNVLDQGDFDDLVIIEVAHQGRNRPELSLLGGAPAPLAGDDLIFALGVGQRPDQDRLEDAAGADRGGQFVQVFRPEGAPGLVGVAPDQLDGEVQGARRPASLRRRRRLDLVEQGREPAPQSPSPFRHHRIFLQPGVIGAPRCARSRPTTSRASFR